MDIKLPAPIVSVRDILPALGFLPDERVVTEQAPAYAYRRPGIDIHVTQLTNFRLVQVFQIGGVVQGRNRLRHVDQEMPLALESADQAAAWLAFAVGTTFKPLVDIEWFTRGCTCQHLLPWVRQEQALKERAIVRRHLRALRPHCVVERHELRRLLNWGATMAGWPPVPELFQIAFDGELLKLRARGRVAAVAAEGKAWTQAYEGPLYEWHRMPKRLEQDHIELGVWSEVLEVERARIPVRAVPGPASGSSDAISTTE